MSRTTKLVLCSVLLMMTCGAAFIAPTSALAGQRFNVIIEYGSPFSSQPGNKTSILTGCGCKLRFKRTRNAGRMVASNDHKGAQLRLKKGEKVVRAFYSIKYKIKEEVREGEETREEEGTKIVHWNGEGILPFESHACIPERCKHVYLLDVVVFALLPHHPPYAELR